MAGSSQSMPAAKEQAALACDADGPVTGHGTFLDPTMDRHYVHPCRTNRNFRTETTFQETRMTMPRGVLFAAAMMALPISAAFGERPLQPRSEADLVITGVVRTIVARDAAYGIDGIKTSYEAEVEVDQVESGGEHKAGDTVRVQWFHVTKPPRQAMFDAYGCDYGIREKDHGRFWLEKSPPSPLTKSPLSKRKWTLLYNNGFEHLGKTKK